VAFYGPDDQHATKVAVGIVRAEGAEADPVERWLSEQADARSDVGGRRMSTMPVLGE
jgi:hypothetical protein